MHSLIINIVSLGAEFAQTENMQLLPSASAIKVI